MNGSLVDELETAQADDAAPLSARNRSLLDGVYRRHWAEICRYVRKTFGAGPPDPEDVAQATFTRFATLKDTNVIANPRAFLFRTAHNIAVDARRSLGRGAIVLADPAVVENNLLDFSPEDVLVTRDELDSLNRAIATLKPKHRAALLMRRLDGLSYAEIGRRLGVSPSGAANLVDRAFELCMASMKRGRA